MLRQTALFVAYEVRKSLHNPVWPLFGLLQPVLYLLLYAPLLSNALPGSSRVNALLEFTPGVAVMVALFGSLFVGFSLIADIRSGLVERLAASAANRAAVILGRVLRDVLVLELQILVLVGVATAMGMRADVAGLGLTMLLMAVAGVLASGISYGLALVVRQENGLSQILQFFALPLILFTGILLPMSLAPRWMQVVADVNPLYHAVEAGRALFVGRLTDSSVAWAFCLLVPLAALSLTWAVRSVSKAVAA